MRSVGAYIILVGATAVGALSFSCSGNSAPARDASAEELSSELAECPGPVGNVPDLVTMLSNVSGWLKLARVHDAQREAEGARHTFPTVVEASLNGRAPIQDHVIELHISYWRGIDWALEHGADVWVALTGVNHEEPGPDVSYVMVVTPADEVFFAGECAHETLFMPAHERYGTALASTLRAAAGTTGRGLTEAVG